ncbi:MAG: hypothetical protein JJU29_08480 [Verrucomicrobia bacterium]|nr:hypothetical protein [Verrucomicrobiota bacterium]MCH8512970.1 hypothetical protein [Kiritimatiellia bacterium]
MKPSKHPKNISWLRILLPVFFQLILIAILVPPSDQPVVAWVFMSTFTLLFGLLFFAIYEKFKGNVRKAHVLTILNATLVFWWVPLSMGIWNLAMEMLDTGSFPCICRGVSGKMR